MATLVGYKVTCLDGSVHYFRTWAEAHAFLALHPDPSDPLYGGHPVGQWAEDMEYVDG